MVENFGVTDEQEILLLKEGHLSSSQLGQGLTALRAANVGDKGAYYLAFFSLTIGLERLMKLILIQQFRLTSSNSFPSDRYLKEKGHKINDLFSEVGGATRPIYADEADQVIVNEMISFFDNFANQSRYYNLDTLVGRMGASIEPLDEWNSIIEKIVERNNIKASFSHEEQRVIAGIDQISMTRIVGGKNGMITDFKDLMFLSQLNEKAQGYATHYVVKIIMHLVDILSDVETEKHIYPYLREFYARFNDYGQSASRMRRKRNWTV